MECVVSQKIQENRQEKGWEFDWNQFCERGRILSLLIKWTKHKQIINYKLMSKKTHAFDKIYSLHPIARSWAKRTTVGDVF